MTNLQNGIFFSFVDNTKINSNNEDFKEKRGSLSPERQIIEKTSSMNSILGGVSNLIHATLLFPFAQPVTPYVINKRKDLVILIVISFIN